MIHGLPGCGKTTLCRRLAERFAGYQYVDLGMNPQFRKQPMMDLCIQEYRSDGAAGNLVTEGYLPKLGVRDRMATGILSGCGLDKALIIGLDELDMDLLASRRNRSAADYELMRGDIEFGSIKHAYVHYSSMPGQRETVDERLDRIMLEVCEGRP